jgi:hypothetical protein
MQIVVKLSIPIEPVLWDLKCDFGWMKLNRSAIPGCKPSSVADAYIDFRVDEGYNGHRNGRNNQCA